MTTQHDHGSRQVVARIDCLETPCLLKRTERIGVTFSLELEPTELEPAVCHANGTADPIVLRENFKPFFSEYAPFVEASREVAEVHLEHLQEIIRAHTVFLPNGLFKLGKWASKKAIRVSSPPIWLPLRVMNLRMNPVALISHSCCLSAF
jgi:hypothetical protein